jgi:hypothetical protein
MNLTKKFKSLSDVLKYYSIRYAKEDFKIVKTINISETFKSDVLFTLNEIPYKVSEAAICENLIYPLLKEAWKLYTDIFSLWSHQSLEDNEGFLRVPDYMISKRSELGKIIFDFPLLAVIEAKKDDFSLGWTQCSLDMIKIKQINKNDDMNIYGIVSNGEIWEIAKLEQQRFVMYKNRFFIEELESLFNALISVLELCKLQLIDLKLLTIAD